MQIVRWKGPLGDFAYVGTATGPGIRDGDVVKATIVGSTITVYVNGVRVLQRTDSTYSNGSPGMGFYLFGPAGANADFGFTSFSASDGGGGITAPAAPTDVGILQTWADC